MAYDEQAMEALKNRRRDDPKDDAIAKGHKDYATWRKVKNELLQYIKLSESPVQFTDEEIITYYKVARYIETEQGMFID